MAKIILSGGGTISHVYPVIETVRALRLIDPSNEFIYLGSADGPEQKIASDNRIKFYAIATAKLHRRFVWQNLWAPYKNIKGYFQAKTIIQQEKGEVVFAKGGFVTLPAIMAACRLRVPVVLHESDSIPGLANRIGVFIANKICLGFPLKYYSSFVGSRGVWTGIPIKPQFWSVQKSAGLFKLSRKLPIVLFCGGSQGASYINQLVMKIAPLLLEHFQIIWLSGKREISSASSYCRKLSVNQQKKIALYDFIDELMPKAIASADLVVSRAGATTIAECASQSRPLILIPLPGSASDHQLQNALILQRSGAAIVKPQDSIVYGDFADLLIRLNENFERKKNLGLNLSLFAKKDSAKLIAQTIMVIVNKISRGNEIY